MWEKSAARITVADTKGTGEALFPFGGTAKQVIIQISSEGLEQVTGAFIVISDCWGAYYYGDPPDPEGEGG